MGKIVGPAFVVYILFAAALLPLLLLSFWIEKRDCEALNAPLECTWEIVPQGDKG